MSIPAKTAPTKPSGFLAALPPRVPVTLFESHRVPLLPSMPETLLTYIHRKIAETFSTPTGPAFKAKTSLFLPCFPAPTP